MILAAGRGKRLQPLTDTVPKPLVPIGRRPLITYTLERLAQYGIHEVIINVAYLGQQIMDTLGNGEQYGVRIQYSIEAQLLEVAGSIVQALPWLGEDTFLVVNGDVWTDYPFAQLIHKAEHLTALGHLVLVRNPPKHPQGDFGLEGEKLLLGDVQPKFTYSGIALYKPEFFKHCAPGRQYMRPLLDEGIAAGTLTGEYYAGEWNDIGTLTCWQNLNERLGYAAKF